MSETATDILERIERNRREQDYCYAVLDLWARVQNQGIEIASVESFGLDTRLLSPREKAQAARARLYRQDDPFVERLPTGGHRLKVYNYVRHHDGTTTRLTPMLKAVHQHG